MTAILRAPSSPTPRRVTRSRTAAQRGAVAPHSPEPAPARPASKRRTSSTVTTAVNKPVPRNGKRKGPAAVPYVKTLASHRTPPISAPRFHVIQEEVAHDLYALLVAAQLWNRTAGRAARPVFFELLARYPTPGSLAGAAPAALTALLRPLGLQRSRAARLRAFAGAWLRAPPSADRRYPRRGRGAAAEEGEALGPGDPREGWEVAHLPGVGPYALDSFRIFARDRLRGVVRGAEEGADGEGEEPEWKRVVPRDKELKALLRWRWLREGRIWDPRTGTSVPASEERVEAERRRERSVSPELI
ncbi:DNA glycosylase [Xylariomycetidae sp. FL0641]|nr:DNA glycosylase [Xylariomycetidae sp. FL0641]